jgi:prephenate dehydrogenase
MKVAIIGAAGKMGAWFCGYFTRHRHSVSAFDIRPFSIGRVEKAKSIARCIADADLVVVCVPVKHTPSVIKQCSRHMKASTSLAEISSVKDRTLPALKKTRKDVLKLCVHPMFGPGASEKKQLRMLAVPVQSRAKELAAIKRVFPEMSIKVLPDAKTHDRAIAAVLGLTYFANVAFAGVLAKEDLVTLKQVGGTTFVIQSMLAESVMTDEPELAAALMRGNPHAAGYIRAYMKEAKALAGASETALASRLERTKKGLQKKADIAASYRRMYRAIGLLKA